MKVIASLFCWVTILFLATLILTVVVYRLIPVYITPLVVIRCLEKGEIKMRHHWVPMDNISRHMPVAAMADEDQRLLLYHGFDYDAIEKVAVYNIKNRTGKKRGVSMITQQTVKNAFLWPGHSWVRKGFEVYFTVLIELIWSKQRIMEAYLNSIEMRDMIYGVDAAVRYRFGKTVGELSRSECALIAAIPPNLIQLSGKAPSGYVRLKQRKIEHEMKFIPSFPKEGEGINLNTTKGGIYHKRR